MAVRWGLRDAPLLWFAAMRALLGGAALAAVAAVQRRPLPRSADTWGRVGALGLVNVSLAFAAMYAGIAGLGTGTAAVLSNAQALLILLPAWWQYGERVTARAGGGIRGAAGGRARCPQKPSDVSGPAGVPVSCAPCTSRCGP